MRVCISIFAWFFMLAILIIVDTISDVTLQKACHTAQLRACIYMFLFFSLNMLMAIMFDFFSDCDNCLFRLSFNIFSKYLPPVYVALSFVLVLLEEKQCGLFDLTTHDAKYPLRLFQFFLILLNVFSPFFYENKMKYVINNNSTIIQHLRSEDSNSANYVLMKDDKNDNNKS